MKLLIYFFFIILAIIFAKAQNNVCGKRKLNIEGLIVNGFPSKPGDWPWHSAIFHRINKVFEYQCGGTVITNRAILTAAHCVFHGAAKLARDRISVYIGRYQLSVSSKDSEEHEVEQIIIHEEYEHFTFLNDIAILKLATEITFNKFIQPACLWAEENGSNWVGQKGIVIGFGTTKSDELSDVLAQGTMPIVSNMSCITSNQDYRDFVTDDMFCAGYRNGTAVCNGDSGGGMFFNVDSVWKIRGIVSFGEKRKDNAKFCNPKAYVIFTDVVKYLKWIEEKLKITKITQKVDSNKIKAINGKDCGLNLDPSSTPELNKQIFQNYPWMAQLEYEVGPENKVMCHGYLINSRYVLTAASCLADFAESYKYKLKNVILGGYDRKSPDTCKRIDGKLKCTDPQTIGIQSFVVHPKFNSPQFANDIALIRLTTDADTSDIESVRPICLPITQELKSIKSNHYLITAWKSKYENSILQREISSIVDSVECQKKYTERNLPLEKTFRQICMNNSNCNFNMAAAPLILIQSMNNERRYFLYGILSIGPKRCGQDFPDVYTHIPNYVDWILNTIQ